MAIKPICLAIVTLYRFYYDLTTGHQFNSIIARSIYSCPQHVHHFLWKDANFLCAIYFFHYFCTMNACMHNCFIIAEGFFLTTICKTAISGYLVKKKICCYIQWFDSINAWEKSCLKIRREPPSIVSIITFTVKKMIPNSPTMLAGLLLTNSS